MPWGLKHFQQSGQLHFLTFSCYRRRPNFATPQSRGCFESSLERVRQSYGLCVYGYVVMPEHVHLLVSEPKKGNPSKALQVLKQKVSRTLRRPVKNLSAQLSLAFAAVTDSPAFWQRRFYDFNVWSDRKVREKLDYMHRNPVQRKLVSDPKDWPWV